MVRGGSWNNNRDNARCAYRNDNHPDNRNNNIGFRVVRGSHIVRFLEDQPRRGWRARRALPEMLADHGRQAEAKEPRMAQASPARTEGRHRRAHRQQGRLPGASPEVPRPNGMLA